MESKARVTEGQGHHGIRGQSPMLLQLGTAQSSMLKLLNNKLNFQPEE
jgi:hypothetical protein